MANPSDTWSRLQDHSTPPPKDAYLRLRGQLFLSRLQHHSVPPPPAVSASIKKAVRPPDNTKPLAPQRTPGPDPRSTSRRLPIRRWLAAAGIAFILAGGAIYWAINRSTPGAVAKSGAQHKQPAASTALPATATDSIGHSPQTPADTSSEKTIAAGTTILHGTAGVPVSHPAIDGHSLLLVDNDLLVTFTSFRYPEIGDYIGKPDEEAFRIHVDQYTNITLSPVMSGFIKDMYSYRKNGKPTRRARKTKERLEKWQAADQKQFDSSARSNPLDPFDLGDFLFR